jgi:serine/threonine-protein kinase RsbW
MSLCEAECVFRKRVLMFDDHRSAPTTAELTTWADSLPLVGAQVVARSDITRPHVYTQLAAAPDQIGVARAMVTDWSRQAGFPPANAQDIVLATDEALSNAVDHAYPGTAGTLTIFAAFARLTNAARIIVSDHGLWRPPPADPGFRGRGLLLMERLTELFRLVHTPRGTTVVLGWSLPG